MRVTSTRRPSASCVDVVVTSTGAPAGRPRSSASSAVAARASSVYAAEAGSAPAAASRLRVQRGGRPVHVREVRHAPQRHAGAVDGDREAVEHPQARELEQVGAGRDRELLGLLECRLADALVEHARGRGEPARGAQLGQAHERVRRLGERAGRDERAAPGGGLDEAVGGERRERASDRARLQTPSASQSARSAGSRCPGVSVPLAI